MGISKNYQKALEITSLYDEFEILEYIKGKSPQLKLKCKNCGEIFLQYQCHYIQHPHVCPRCHPKGISQYISQDEAQNRVNNAYGEGHFRIGKYTGNNNPVEVICLLCGHVFSSVPDSLWRRRLRGCPNCEISHSLGENFIAKTLRENGINFQEQKRFIDCKDKQPLPFDFFLPDYNLCIEFQGEQSHDASSRFYLDTLIKHDEIKKKYCANNSLQLLEITYKQFDDIPDIIKALKNK